MPSRDKPAEFTARCAQHSHGDETFRSGTAEQIIPAQLLTWKRNLAAKNKHDDAVTAPGVPKHYSVATKLVTEDGIRPGAS